MFNLELEKIANQDLRECLEDIAPIIESEKVSQGAEGEELIALTGLFYCKEYTTTLGVSHNDLSHFIKDIRKNGVVETQFLENMRRPKGTKPIGLKRIDCYAMTAVVWQEMEYHKCFKKSPKLAVVVPQLKQILGDHPLSERINLPVGSNEIPQNPPRKELPVEAHGRRQKGDTPQFSFEEQVELELILLPNLIDFRKEQKEVMRRRFRFERDVSEGLDTADKRIQILGFIHGVWQMVMKLKYEEVYRESRVHSKSSIEVTFDINLKSQNDILQALDVTINFLTQKGSGTLIDVFEKAKLQKIHLKNLLQKS